jgi:HEAT repeat protein
VGLFGLFDSPAEKLKKLGAKVKEKWGPPENRQKAIDQLIEIGTPEAWEALCGRWTISISVSITDDEEKQRVLDAIVGAGDAAIEPVRRFLFREEQAAWAMKALEKLQTPEALTGTLIEALERIGPEYTRDPDKKITLLRALRERRDARIAPAVVPFMEDMSEDVKIAAADVLAAQQDERGREPVIRLLEWAHAEKSERAKKAAAESLVALGMPVTGHRPAVEAALPVGYFLDREGKVHKK